MDKKAINNHYQTLVEQLREFENEHYSGWPGKPCGTPAHSKYPNIVAEINAEGHSIRDYAAWANVSPEIMAAIIEDGEDLCLDELNGIVSHFHNYRNLNFGYIVFEGLQVIAPETKRGKACAEKLREAMRTLERKDIQWGDNDYYLNKWCKRTVTWILGNFERGELVSYAGYRRALDDANSILSRAKRAIAKAQAPVPRGERLAL